MKSFEWANAATVDDAVKLLGGGDSKTDPDDIPRPMGGGQDLLTTMKSYITRPPRVVNLKTINGTGKIVPDGSGGLKIDALVTLTAIANHADVQKSFPGLVEAAHSIATPQIRNLGTVGGNLNQRPRCWYFRAENLQCLKRGGDTCYAVDGENKYHAIFGNGPCVMVHPSDLSPMLMALNATVTIAGKTGLRVVPIDSFFVLPKTDVRRENVVAAGEIVTEIHLPATAAKSTYLKFKERSSLDFAMASVAAVVEFNDDKTVKAAKIVLGGVAPIPWHVPKVDAFLTGKKLDDTTIAEAAKIALDGADPLTQNSYKIPLTQTLVRRALMKVNA
jgi:xanthine dehydrogenase YagS FAD-binding subunit